MLGIRTLWSIFMKGKWEDAANDRQGSPRPGPTHRILRLQYQPRAAGGTPGGLPIARFQYATHPDGGRGTTRGRSLHITISYLFPSTSRRSSSSPRFYATLGAEGGSAGFPGCRGARASSPRPRTSSPGPLSISPEAALGSCVRLVGQATATARLRYPCGHSGGVDPLEGSNRRDRRARAARLDRQGARAGARARIRARARTLTRDHTRRDAHAHAHAHTCMHIHIVNVS